MEQAEHALFRSMGSTIFPVEFHRGGMETPPITWPRVRCECEYFAPARFEDVLNIRVVIERLGVKSVTYAHRIFCGETLIARGRIVAVCSMHEASTGRLVGCPIPETIRLPLSKFLMVGDTDLPSG